MRSSECRTVVSSALSQLASTSCDAPFGAVMTKQVGGCGSLSFVSTRWKSAKCLRPEIHNCWAGVISAPSCQISRNRSSGLKDPRLGRGENAPRVPEAQKCRRDPSDFDLGSRWTEGPNDTRKPHENFAAHGRCVTPGEGRSSGLWRNGRQLLPLLLLVHKWKPHTHRADIWEQQAA